jgi:purine-cytosine permease-like protein
MVQVKRQADEARDAETIGRRVGGQIETVGVAPVPDDQRVQTPRSMFIVWLMASASATTPLIGALLFKFGLTDMIIAIVAAWLIGFIPAGLFSEMGREVPLSGLVVARKTFGWDGSLLFSVLCSRWSTSAGSGSTPRSARPSWPPSRTRRSICGTWSSALCS